MCVSQKGVYSNDDSGKLKSKDSNHTRRSKQNIYHVVNKNIAASFKVSAELLDQVAVARHIRVLGVPVAGWLLGYQVRDAVT